MMHLWRRAVGSAVPGASRAWLENRAVLVSWSDGRTTPFHFPWLRDHCPSRVDPDSGQKSVSSGDDSVVGAVASSVALDGGVLNVDWADGHRSAFPLPFLRRTAYDDVSRQDRSDDRNRLTQWDSSHRIPEAQYSDVVNSDTSLARLLDDIHNFGIAFVRNVPTDLDASKAISSRIGPVRETFYGTLWDVVSVPKAINVAYTSSHLGLHQDLLYFEAPPGLQLLHCVKNSVPGGDAIFLDAYRAVAELRAEDPLAYMTLLECPVTFHYRAQGRHRRFVRPTLELDGQNEAMRVNYAPPFQGPLEVPQARVQEFYEAFNKFERVLDRKHLLFRTRYQPGDLVIFNNRRVLHGRLQFDAAKGERHLRGSYIDLDEYRDKWRTMCRPHW